MDGNFNGLFGMGNINVNNLRAYLQSLDNQQFLNNLLNGNNNQNNTVNNQNNQTGTNRLYARIVTQEDDILAQEVPMNRKNPGLFLTEDGKTIYKKFWENNGSIDTKVYTLVEEVEEVNGEPEPTEFDLIMERLQALEEKLSSLTIPAATQTTSSRKSNAKKEEIKDE